MAHRNVERTIVSCGLRTIVCWRKTSGCTQAHGHRAKRVLMRGVGAGRSAQRGTCGATTGPRGARSAPPNPDIELPASSLLQAVDVCEYFGHGLVQLERDLVADLDGLEQAAGEGDVFDHRDACF